MYPLEVQRAYHRRFETPLGLAFLVTGARGLLASGLLADEGEIEASLGAIAGTHELLPDDGACAEAIDQLEAYFRGDRRCFDLPLDLRGTQFQRAVWRALLEIPYGETRSYGDVARMVGRPGAARAVGQASHRNPLGVVVPCHRVLGQDGALTGYAGGLGLKERLLALEARHARATLAG